MADSSAPLGAAKFTLVSLAKRWIALTEEIALLDVRLAELVQSAAPSLIAIKGVGVETGGISAGRGRR